MFGTNLLDRRSRPERIRDQAWEHLVSAISSAGEAARGTARSARRTTAQLTDDTGDRLEVVADEAWRRASRALDALAGRRPATPWTWIIGAAAVGVALGWAAGSAARAGLARAEGGESLEFVDVDRPNSPVGLDG